jgi:hypothetical protein
MPQKLFLQTPPPNRRAVNFHKATDSPPGINLGQFQIRQPIHFHASHQAAAMLTQWFWPNFYVKHFQCFRKGDLYLKNPSL